MSHASTLNGLAEWLEQDDPDAADDIRAAAAHIERLEEALRWYEERLRDCRKVTREGDEARAQLSSDRGDRARAALSASAEGEEER
jgi:hypothetical protein